MTLCHQGNCDVPDFYQDSDDGSDQLPWDTFTRGRGLRALRIEAYPWLAIPFRYRGEPLRRGIFEGLMERLRPLTPQRLAGISGGPSAQLRPLRAPSRKIRRGLQPFSLQNFSQREKLRPP